MSEQGARSRLPKQINELFIGPNGLRAGWRLLVAVTLYFIFYFSVAFAVDASLGSSAYTILTSGSPKGILMDELVMFVPYVVTVCIMSRLEGHRISDYGLGLRDAFGRNFWVAAVAGFAGVSVLLFSLRVAGVYRIGGVSLHGAEILKYLGIWSFVAFLIAVQEENVSRGYALFTLTTGMTFWPAAMLTSVGFGLIHILNGGENRIGLFTVAMIGFFFCILIRKTGNLWAAIGFHAAWDWAESFFYGVPDSGLVSPGYLFGSIFARGHVLLTGGTDGPEASVFCVILLALLCVAAGLIRGAQYPGAVKRHRPDGEPPATLFET